MTVLRYTVPPENEGCKLGLFLRMQGVTAGLIKSVKYDGDGFYTDVSCSGGSAKEIHIGDAAADTVFHRL